MKKTIPYTIIFLSIISIVITHIMPFKIYAESGTYYETDACTMVWSRKNSNYPNDPPSALYILPLSDARIVYLKYNNQIIPYLITINSSNRYWNATNSTGCGNNTPSSTFNSHSYNGTTFYYWAFSSANLNASYYYDWVFIDDLQVIELETNLDAYGRADLAYRYAYGDLAEEPTTEPVINHGSLKVGYNTDFVSNGNGVSGYNRDNITWDNYDTNGNLLDDLNYSIELRAIPGYYEDVSYSQLIAQTVANFVVGYAMQLTNGAINLQPVEYYYLWRGTPNKKTLQYTWAEVVNHFDIFIDTVKAGQYGDKYYKSGWRYEIRYKYHTPEDDDYYESPWQIIYQVTASAPSTSENIYNQLPNGISPELYNLLQTVNTLNNTVQNWNINGVPLQIQPTGTPTQDGSWIERLIEAITTIVGKIVDVIGGVFNTLISDLAELVNSLGVNILDFFTNIINTITSNNDAIDLTLPEFNLDSDSLDALGEFKELTNAYTDIFINSGLWFVIVVPLVIFLLRVVF